MQVDDSVQKVELPVDLATLDAHWEIEDKSANVPIWDFMWNAITEEGREKTLLQNAFVTGVEHLPHISESTGDSIHVAESALKVGFRVFDTHIYRG